MRNLYKKLELETDGFDPWFDEEDLIPGEEWQKEIPKAVRRSDVVLVCLSVRSIMKSGYVQKELSYALDVAEEQPEGTIFIIPLRLEECEVPERLSRWQWVDLYRENGYERLMRALRRRMETIKEDSDPAPEDQSQTETIPQSAAPPAESQTTPESEPAASLSEEQPQSKTIQPVVKPSADSQTKQVSEAVDSPTVARGPQTTVREARGRYKIHPGIRAAIIVVAAAALLAASYRLFYQPVPEQQAVIQYTGRVVNAITGEPVHNAKVSIEKAENTQQIQDTNAEGIFRLTLPESMKSGRLKVEAETYNVVNRDITFSKSDIEQIRLIPINHGPDTTHSPAPAASPAVSNTNKNPTRVIVKSPTASRNKNTSSDLEEKKKKARDAMNANDH